MWSFIFCMHYNLLNFTLITTYSIFSSNLNWFVFPLKSPLELLTQILAPKMYFIRSRLACSFWMTKYCPHYICVFAGFTEICGSTTERVALMCGTGYKYFVKPLTRPAHGPNQHAVHRTGEDLPRIALRMTRSFEYICSPETDSELYERGDWRRMLTSNVKKKISWGV